LTLIDNTTQRGGGMVVLAAETSTSINTVALCEGDRLLAEVVVESGRGHSERLLDTIAWLLAEGGITFSQVDLLATAIGPGSFTGLRIGAATMKGLAFSRQLPLAGVSTLRALARLSAPRDETVHALLDARMKEVFWAAFRWEGASLVRETDDRVCPVDAVIDGARGPAYLIGDGALLYRDTIAAALPEARFACAEQHHPRAASVAQEALALAASGADLDPGLIAPVYLRASQAEVNRDARASQGAVP